MPARQQTAGQVGGFPVAAASCSLSRSTLQRRELKVGCSAESAAPREARGRSGSHRGGRFQPKAINRWKPGAARAPVPARWELIGELPRSTLAISASTWFGPAPLRRFEHAQGLAAQTLRFRSDASRRSWVFPRVAQRMRFASASRSVSSRRRNGVRRSAEPGNSQTITAGQPQA